MIDFNLKEVGPLDHFIRDDKGVYAGKHWLIDIYGASNLDAIDFVEKALREAVKVAEATLLHIHLHKFSPNGGISGVAVLAESHISLHTWPEVGFAAFDVFMCGEAKPELTLDVFKSYFKPEHIDVRPYRRGVDLK